MSALFLAIISNVYSDVEAADHLVNFLSLELAQQTPCAVDEIHSIAATKLLVLSSISCTLFSPESCSEHPLIFDRSASQGWDHYRQISTWNRLAAGPLLDTTHHESRVSKGASDGGRRRSGM